MTVTVKTTKLQKLIEKENELQKAFGAKRARLVMRRITFLQAAASLADVPVSKPLRRHELTGKRKGEYAVDVDEKLRIVFVPDHDPVPLLPDGGIDTGKVTAIQIIAVEDYH